VDILPRESPRVLKGAAPGVGAERPGEFWAGGNHKNEERGAVDWAVDAKESSGAGAGEAFGWDQVSASNLRLHPKCMSGALIYHYQKQNPGRDDL